MLKRVSISLTILKVKSGFTANQLPMWCFSRHPNRVSKFWKKLKSADTRSVFGIT
jgi:hypothetical protein